MTNITVTGNEGVTLVMLDRAEALNSLNQSMVESLLEVLDSAATRKSSKLLVFKGSGGRAFCAGGDIKAARLGAIAAREGKMPLEKVVDFFVDEYRMNKKLFHYPKPTISYMNGITMGGGVGIAGACQYRIATGKTMWAMPEVSIGFFPDVGAAYYLARAPFKTGRYLALTGAHIDNPADLIQCGLATHFIPLEKESALIEAMSLQPHLIEEILADLSSDPGECSLPYEKIEACFSANSVEEIIGNLERDGSEWARQTATLIQSKAPTSLKVALKHIMLAETESFDDVIARDLNLAAFFLAGDDLIEGVRAMVVDKDRAPKWNPSRLGDVGTDQIDAIFNQNLGLVL